MAYISLSDIEGLLPESEIIQLTDDERLGEVNASRVADVIEQADSEVNSYLGVLYSVPLAASQVSDLVKKLSVDIAIYNLYSRGTAETVPEMRQVRYENAIATLKGLAKGDMMLDADPLPDTRELEDGAQSSTTTDNNNIFTRDKMEGF